MYILCKKPKKEGEKVANHVGMCYNQSKKWMGRLPQMRQEEHPSNLGHNKGHKHSGTLPSV